MSLLCNEAPPGYLRPLVETDETHQRASIIIATAVLLFAALLFVGSRLWVRLNPDRDNTGGVGVAATDGTILGLEDLLVVIATAFYILHASLVFIACAEGLGNTSRSIERPAQIAKIEKLYYASKIVYVLSLGSSEASVSWLMVRINSSREPTVKRSMKAVTGVIALWTLATTFLTMFACPADKLVSQSTQQCPEWYTAWLVLGVGASCIEVAITGVAVWNVWNLHVMFLKKALVVALVGSRLPIIPLTAMQLASFSYHPLDADPTLNITIFICLSELVLCYSICSANFPAFRRLTKDIRTGMGSLAVDSSHVYWSRISKRSKTGTYMHTKHSHIELESDAVPINSHDLEVMGSTGQPTGLHMSKLTGRPEDYTVEVTNGDSRSMNSLGVSENESTDLIIRTRTEVVVVSDAERL